MPIGLTCFTRRPIKSTNLSSFFAEHSDIGEGITHFPKTTPKTRVSYSGNETATHFSTNLGSNSHDHLPLHRLWHSKLRIYHACDNQNAHDILAFCSVNMDA